MRKFFVLVIALVLLAVPMLPAFAAGSASQDIVDIAVADGRFTTLVAAVQAAGLVDALKGPGPLTVFAPTDAAFAALGQDTINALLNDVPTLTNILLYHVVPGKALAGDVVNLKYAPTLEGAGVDIEVRDGKVFLNGTTQVIITDIIASNGVIHVIDAVLLPPRSGKLALVTSNTPIFDGPNGNLVAGKSLKACQTVFVTAQTYLFAEVQTMGGWIPSSAFTFVPANYGQPGGTPVADFCASK
jgi:uncharacterized surface protein with fasciclin (FAS1) repeats